MTRKPWFDAGHGGHDPGAVGLIEEEDVALAIVKFCMEAAERQGFDPKATRTTDKFVALSERCRLANAYGADAFVSVHLDWKGAKGKGFAVIEPKNASARTDRLSDVMMANLDPLTNYKDIGVYTDRRGLAVLRGTRMPATLIEVLSVGDAVVKSESFQRDVAETIVRSLCAWYGVRYVAPSGSKITQPKPKPKAAPRPKQTHPEWPGRYMRKGHHGDDVEAMQKRLKARGWKIDVDGIYGKDTEKVVRAFQDEKGLQVDGVCGPATWDALWTAKITR